MDKKKKSKMTKSNHPRVSSREKQSLPEIGVQNDEVDSEADFEIQFDFDDAPLGDEQTEDSMESVADSDEAIATEPIEIVEQTEESELGIVSQSEEFGPHLKAILLPFDDFEEIFEGELRPRPEDRPSLSAAKQSQRNSNSSMAVDQSLNFQEALNLEGQVEALLFAAAKPLKSTDIMEILQNDEEATEVSLKDIDKTIQSLIRWYEERSGGFRLESIKGMGFQFQTVPAAASLMERLFSSRPRPLSRAALETLSIIAYRQPVTRADVEYVRGVDAGSIIKNLLDRSLIACVGRKEDSGRPMLFGTTDEFLKVFRLQALSDLPPLSAFQPSADTISRAMEDLSEAEVDESEGIDVESFIGDENQSLPDLSEGLTEEGGDYSAVSDSSVSSWMTNDAGQEPMVEVEEAASEGFDADSEDSLPLTTGLAIEGAVFFDKQAELDFNAQADDRGDWNDEGSKVSVTDGSDLPKGSGKVDSGRSRRQKRRGDQTTRDSD